MVVASMETATDKAYAIIGGFVSKGEQAVRDHCAVNLMRRAACLDLNDEIVRMAKAGEGLALHFMADVLKRF